MTAAYRCDRDAGKARTAVHVGWCGDGGGSIFLKRAPISGLAVPLFPQYTLFERLLVFLVCWAIECMPPTYVYRVNPSLFREVVSLVDLYNIPAEEAEEELISRLS